MVAFTVLQTRCPEKGAMTIEEVNSALDKIAVCNANKDRAGNDAVMKCFVVDIANLA